MIDGFKIEITANELAAHLDSRISHHRGRTQECEMKLQRLQALDAHSDEEEDVFDMCGASRLDGLQRLASKHRSREVFLMFVRNHVVTNEVYRLSEEDLRLLEWLPVEEFSAIAGRF